MIHGSFPDDLPLAVNEARDFERNCGPVDGVPGGDDAS